MAEPRLLVVDAFCDRPFTGNPAAVCILESPRSSAWMQQVAAEMNLSETAFVCPQGDEYDLRWFTPTIEVDLCGHATLATARALWHAGARPAEKPFVFHSRSGDLTARVSEESADLIVLDFPVTFCEPVKPPDGFLEALGLVPEAVRYVGRNKFDYFLELADEAIVRGLTPDFVRLGALRARGVIVTAAAGTTGPEFRPYDFVSRFFAPSAGINEDPVTGSAHCALAPYWADRLGRSRLMGYQASRRGGYVQVERRNERVLLGGRAIVVSDGRLSPEAWAEGL
jgi:PhzF family phenazine biosynthesis protein